MKCKAHHVKIGANTDLRRIFPDFKIGDVVKGISGLRYQFIICPKCKGYDMQRYIETIIIGVEL